ncbi:hypothetical protein G5B38_13675 [Pseudohalocynthiibacter aestuariivivens]|uniref:HdeA/HdeB family protein n=1 Tax=Roseovarius pelagicus TaxID=2980108 RepID=A0ABY6DFQ5_9RHOB|nr:MULTISPECIES: hypothetical protein [Rhodobacterales]QIE46486.1 hypothetical protein G5B38_13675 [Pseudohalocynthiibacter aestuariivivens]UXX84992.1 hypothetical protein N7U68_10265 [Roseovarius pelagicus]
MISLNTAKMTAAAFGLSVLAQGAFAEAHGDMACSDYLVLEEADQMTATETGREAARERMSGDDADRAEMLANEDPKVVHAFVVETCAENPEMMVSDAAEALHPSEKTE